MNPVVTFADVCFSYGGPLVLEHVDLAIEESEFMGLVGPNGGGKSTLLKILLGLLEPASGRVRVLGSEPAQARRAVGYVPQFAAFPRDFPISAEEMVLQGRLGHTRLLGGYRAADRKLARQAMRDTEVWDLHARPIGSLSGGQLQRLLIARALATQPRLLVLDEPTANIALLTLPAAIAAQYLHRLAPIMVLAAVLGMLFTSGGLALSYGPDLPAGATIILVAGAAYLVSFLVTGVVRRYRA